MQEYAFDLEVTPDGADGEADGAEAMEEVQ